jgi:hypothetical protein
MSDSILLISAMAEQCRDMILGWNRPCPDLPASLRLKHLQWMCNQIVQNSGNWPDTRLHRWIGFVQGAMIANQMIDLDAAKAMFNQAKNAFGEVDEDLLDHLNPDESFKLDLGGQG